VMRGIGRLLPRGARSVTKTVGTRAPCTGR